MPRIVIALILLALFCADARAGQAQSPLASPGMLNPSAAASEKSADPDDSKRPVDYGDVVHGLIQQMMGDAKSQRDPEELAGKKMRLKRDHEESREEREQHQEASAQDAARKLASMKKEAVPALAQLFRTTWDKPDSVAGATKASYYSAWALARIRNADAARALLPALTTTTARSELRHFAVEAMGLEKCEEGVRALQKVAAADPDVEIRKKAFGQLTIIPEYWDKSEPIFLKALSDPDSDIRTLAAKACHFSHIFLSCNDKLVELIESDPVPGVRMLAMLTLGRQRHKAAQPALVRVLESPDTDEKLRKVALSAFCQISEISFSKIENALAWWKKEGEAKFTEAERREQAKAEQLKQLDDIEKRERRDTLKKVQTAGDSVPPLNAPFADPGIGMIPLQPPALSFPSAPSPSAPMMLAKPEGAPPAVKPVVPAKPLVDLLPPDAPFSLPPKAAAPETPVAAPPKPARTVVTPPPPAERVRGTAPKQPEAVPGEPVRRRSRPGE